MAEGQRYLHGGESVSVRVFGYTVREQEISAAVIGRVEPGPNGHETRVAVALTGESGEGAYRPGDVLVRSASEITGPRGAYRERHLHRLEPVEVQGMKIRQRED